jgi:hypothetical protein
VPVRAADAAADHFGDRPVGLRFGTVDVLYFERFLEFLEYHCLHRSVMSIIE